MKNNKGRHSTSLFSSTLSFISFAPANLAINFFHQSRHLHRRFSFGQKVFPSQVNCWHRTSSQTLDQLSSIVSSNKLFETALRTNTSCSVSNMASSIVPRGMYMLHHADQKRLVLSSYLSDSANSNEQFPQDQQGVSELIALTSTSRSADRHRTLGLTSRKRQRTKSYWKHIPLQ